MASKTFVLVLAALTAATGMALLVMLWRRRQKRRLERDRLARARRERELADRIERAAEAHAEAMRLAEEASKPPGSTLPDSWSADDDDDEDEELHEQICPSCGSRYHYGVRVCRRDASELRALN